MNGTSGRLARGACWLFFLIDGCDGDHGCRLVILSLSSCVVDFSCAQQRFAHQALSFIDKSSLVMVPCWPHRAAFILVLFLFACFFKWAD